MSDLLLNLDELNVRHERSDENRIKLYDSVLHTCHNKIKKYNMEFKKQDCLFTPPPFIIGKPPYNYLELVNYLLTSLRNNGLRAEWLTSQKAIYISWKRSDVDMKQYQTHFSNTIYSDDSSRHLSVVTVRTPSETTSKKRKSSHTLPGVQHVAMLEYNPVAKDYIPINTKNLPS